MAAELYWKLGVKKAKESASTLVYRPGGEANLGVKFDETQQINAEAAAIGIPPRWAITGAPAWWSGLDAEEWINKCAYRSTTAVLGRSKGTWTFRALNARGAKIVRTLSQVPKSSQFNVETILMPLKQNCSRGQVSPPPCVPKKPALP